MQFSKPDIKLPALAPSVLATTSRNGYTIRRMECSTCQTSNQTGQKFCGACGHELVANCGHCGAQNPPHYKFCGQCGRNIAKSGTIALARSGLITQVNQEALDVLGYRQSEIMKKPFSLLIEREDLAVFFSHWNALLSNAKPQSFELALKHRETKSVYVRLECQVAEHSSKYAQELLLFLNDVTESRLVAAQIQYFQDLTGLIFSATDNLSTVSDKHLKHSIEDALKKICLFTKADRCFIYGINRSLKQLELGYQWRQPLSSPPGNDTGLKRIPIAAIKDTILKLRQKQVYAINDATKLTASERNGLQAWFQVDIGAFICHLIYSRDRPIGVIGIIKNTADGEWAPECIALVKFFGQVVSNRLASDSFESRDTEIPHPSSIDATESKKIRNMGSWNNIIDINPKRPMHHKKQINTGGKITHKKSKSRPIPPDITRPMVLEKVSSQLSADQQPVFPRDDGLVLVTCPICGLRESVSVSQFVMLGNAISVFCRCNGHFTAVLEKRRSFRKSVRLEGYFTLQGDLGPANANSSIWGPILVNDLSKVGLRFSSKRADLVHPGDILMVRFNLDNSNQALINKPARVISATKYEVGCKFEGADSYDITLGFYFI